MIILRTSDIVPCKIGDLTIWVSPLSWDQKVSLYKHTQTEGGQTQVHETAMLMDTLKLSIKKVDGFETMKFVDGTQAALDWENGQLTIGSLEMLVRAIGPIPISNLSSAVLRDALAGDINGFEVDIGNAKSIETKKKDTQ